DVVHVSWWRRQWGFDFFERAIEALQHALKLHGHLKGKGPAGHIVRRRRRSAGIREVIRVILRLEEIEHVGTKRLRGFHDVGAAGIFLAGRSEEHTSELQSR